MPAVVDRSRPASLTVPVALSGLPVSSPAGAKLGTPAASTGDKSKTRRDMWPPGWLLSQKLVDLLTRSHSAYGKCHSRARICADEGAPFVARWRVWGGQCARPR